MTSTSSDDYKLLDPEGQTPEQVLGIEADFKLPLPVNDRERMESRLRRRQLKRISIAELLIVTTAVCLLFALSTWFSLKTFSAILGVVVFVAGLVAKFAKFNSRISILFLFTLACGYLVSIVVALLQTGRG